MQMVKDLFVQSSNMKGTLFYTYIRNKVVKHFMLTASFPNFRYDKKTTGINIY